MKHLLLAPLLFIFSSCAENKTPEDILHMDQMTQLVEDITLTETYYQSKFGVPSEYKKALDQSVDKILLKAKTDRQTFEKSLAYYAEHPQLQKELNDRLLMQLSRKVN